MFETHLKGDASIFSKVEFSNVNIFNFPTFGRTYDITQQTKIEAPERQCSSAPKEVHSEKDPCVAQFICLCNFENVMPTFKMPKVF